MKILLDGPYGRMTLMGYEVESFRMDVIELSRRIPVVVDFWAEWCAPCRILGPVLERLAQKHQGHWELKKVDTETFTETALEYQVRSIPNVKMFVDGKVVDEFVGALPEPAVEQWLVRALPDPNRAVVASAEALVRSQEFGKARALLEPLVEAHAEHQQAKALLAVSLIYSDGDKALHLVEGIDEGSKEFETAECVRSIVGALSRLRNGTPLPDSPARSAYAEALQSLVSKDFDSALRRLIDVLREDRYYDEDSARKICIAVFRYLGEEHPITVKHRRDFGSALFK